MISLRFVRMLALTLMVSAACSGKPGNPVSPSPGPAPSNPPSGADSKPVSVTRWNLYIGNAAQEPGTVERVEIKQGRYNLDIFVNNPGRSGVGMKVSVTPNWPLSVPVVPATFSQIAANREAGELNVGIFGFAGPSSLGDYQVTVDVAETDGKSSASQVIHVRVVP
jgi:hypothetical protein